MTKATGVACRPPAPPAAGHADMVLAQVFSISDSHHTSYLLGWQIVPYKGVGTYSLGTAGNLLAPEPAVGGRPLGYGKGTVTFVGNSDAGTVQAVVQLKAGGTVSIAGNWDCSAA